jgi:hypothetical protein
MTGGASQFGYSYRSPNGNIGLTSRIRVLSIRITQIQCAGLYSSCASSLSDFCSFQRGYRPWRTGKLDNEAADTIRAPADAQRCIVRQRQSADATGLSDSGPALWSRLPLWRTRWTPPVGCATSRSHIVGPERIGACVSGDYKQPELRSPEGNSPGEIALGEPARSAVAGRSTVSAHRLIQVAFD